MCLLHSLHISWNSLKTLTNHLFSSFLITHYGPLVCVISHLLFIVSQRFIDIFRLCIVSFASFSMTVVVCLGFSRLRSISCVNHVNRDISVSNNFDQTFWVGVRRQCYLHSYLILTFKYLKNKLVFKIQITLSWHTFMVFSSMLCLPSFLFDLHSELPLIWLQKDSAHQQGGP